MKKVYICSDTITGIFSAIYDAWKESRDGEAGIELRGMLDTQLFCEYTEVTEEERKAAAVEKLIQNHLGYNTYWDIYHALLSTHPKRRKPCSTSCRPRGRWATASGSWSICPIRMWPACLS